MSLPPQSPSMLPPPPKRGKGVRRLNKVPTAIIFGAGLLVLGGFVYSYRVRLLQTTATTQESVERHPEAASGAAVTANKPRGGKPMPPAQPVAFHPPAPMMIPNPLSAPSSPASTAPAMSQPQDTGQRAAPMEDMATQARRSAWQTYYTQTAMMQQARLDAARDALKADTSLTQAGGSAGAPNGSGSAPQAGGAPPAVPVAAGGFGGFGAGYPPPTLPDATGAREKQAFLAQQGNTGQANDIILPSLRPPLSPYLVSAGDFLPAIATTGENSDTPGTFIARIKTTIYDSATGLIPLIPENAKLIGTYDNVVSAGQKRIPTVLTAIKFPDGSTQPLGAMPAADMSGFAGLHDIVETHLGEKFINALISSLPGAAIQIGVSSGSSGGYNGGYSAQQQAAASVAQQVGQLAQEQARAGLSIPNTVIIRPGMEFVVTLTKDVYFPGPYVDRRQAPGRGINVALPIMQ